MNISGYLTQYGYVALFVGVLLENAGVPIPGETMLLAASVMAASGRLSVPFVVLTAAVAAMVGDNIGYFIGRAGGRPFLERWWGKTERGRARLDRAALFYRHYGAPAVIGARFLAGVRVVGALVAGASDMAWPRFALFNAIGAVLWASMVTTIGFLGDKAGAALHLSARVTHTAVGVGLLTLATVFAVLAIRNQRLRGDADADDGPGE